MNMNSRVLTVTQLNEYVKMLIDSNPILDKIFVRGEISNLKFHGSGHIFFSIKDSNSKVSAIMFRSDASKLRFVPENGMNVIVGGRLSVFLRDGTFQIYVSDLQPDGVGTLYIAYEQLKRKLESQGLFNENLKKPLPKIPNAVGVITSATGAAVKDIINVTGRRFPYAKIIIFPSLVQGEGAENSLIEGLHYFNSKSMVDVIIIGRGGGSIEDLWAFNSEKLALEIRRSNIPVISAVGHETDFTICDFVADKRAPTPSAGAELAVPDTYDIKIKLSNAIVQMNSVMEREIKHLKEKLNYLSERRVLTTPKAYFDDQRTLLLSYSREIYQAFSKYFLERKNRFIKLSSVLQAVSPLKIISKGYSAVFNQENKLIKSVSDVKKGEKISFILSDGMIGAEVTNIDNKKITDYSSL